MKTTRRFCVLFFVCWEIAQSSIKKETSNLFRPEGFTQSKTRFLERKRATRLGHKAVHDTKPAS